MKRTFAFLMLAILTVIAFGITVFLFTQNIQKGALQVTSIPNSKVYLDGKLIGTTPLCKCDEKNTIREGGYTIKLVPIQGDFSAFEQKINIHPNVLTVVDRSFAKDLGSSASIITLSKLNDKNSISLQVTSFPLEAKVFVDSNFVGDSPLSLDTITESDHELRISKLGYDDKKILAKAAKGYRLEVQVFLAANPQEENIATPSASIVPNSPRVLILQTPTGFLRVRNFASLSGNQIGQVLPGETYDLLDEQSGWYKIKLTDGTLGWISSQYAEKQP